MATTKESQSGTRPVTPTSQKHEVTVLSVSLRGFARLAESAPAADLIAFFRAYVGQLEAVAATHGGQFLRSLGDTVVWVHGMAQADHAVRACHTAIELVHRAHLLQTRSPTNTLPPLDIDIGISTGPVVTCGTGADFAVIGDVVEFAAHLRSLNTTYGTHVLLSEPTWREARKSFSNFREIDVLQIHGRPEPVRLYELMLPRHYAELGWVAEFSRGYDLYHAGLRPQARLVFQHLAEHVNDPVSRCLLERCSALRRRRDD